MQLAAPWGGARLLGMRLVLVLLPALVFLGCNGPCEKRSGQYRLTAERRTGTCGSGYETIVTAGQATNPDCDIDTNTAADNCRVTVTGSCPTSTGAVWTTGVTDWSADGTTGTGFIEMEASGSAPCQGTFDVTYKKL
jgi:hypothetical protein